MTRTISIAAALLTATPILAVDPPVTAVAVRADGHQIAFGVGREVRLYGTGGEWGTSIPVPEGRITALAYIPEKNSLASWPKWLAVASAEPGRSGTVRVYELPWTGGQKIGAPVIEFDGHKDAIYALAWSPDGRTLATAGYDRVIHLWEFTGQPPKPKAEIIPSRTLKDHSDTIYGLAFSPDGKLLASAAADRAVKVWDPGTGVRLYTLSEPTDWVYAVAWSPDGKSLVAGGADKSIRVWAADRSAGKLVHAVYAHEQAVWRLAFTRDGKRLFSVGEDRVVKAWDVSKMVETKVYPAQPDAILDFAIHPDAEWYAIARYDGVGRLFDVGTGAARPKNGFPPIPRTPPKPMKANPPALVRRQYQPVTVTGADLEHVKWIETDHPGVRGQVEGTTTPGELKLAISVDSSVPAGTFKLVLVNAVGKSAPINMIIDRQTATPESKLVDTARGSMSVTPNVTVAGTIDRAGDVDAFRFKADRGYQLGVQVVASEIGSKLDPILVLADDTGAIQAEGTATLGYVIPKPGFYTVALRDREYRGGADFPYRIHIGDVPVITGVFPLGVTRGTTNAVHVVAVNTFTYPEITRAVQVAVPRDAVPGSRITATLPEVRQKPLGNASVVVDEFPSFRLDETPGMTLPVPGTADGLLAKPGDSHTVRFTAKAGQRLVVEVNARRIGSPLDSVIEILDAAGKPVSRATLRSTAKIFSTFRDHDSASPGIRLESWSELAINDYLYADGELMRVFALPKNPDDDCQFYQVAGQRLGFLDTTPNHHAMGCAMYRVETHPPGTRFPPNGLPVFDLTYRNDDGGPGYGKDSRVFFDPPADGTYQVRISDVRGSGSPAHAYRLTIRPPKPDFTVTFTPNSPTVWKGGAVSIGVTATRLDGYQGPIEVRLEGLPPGFHAPVTFIEEGQTSTAVALSATSGATVPPGTRVRVVAQATIAGQSVTRESEGGPLNLAEPGDVVTTTRQDAVVLRPGHETRLVVDVQRRGDFKGRIPLEVRGLPHGVRVLNIGLNGILITERDTSREIVLYAEPWVRTMEHPIVVVARSERKGTEHAARSVMLRIDR